MTTLARAAEKLVTAELARAEAGGHSSLEEAVKAGYSTSRTCYVAALEVRTILGEQQKPISQQPSKERTRLILKIALEIQQFEELEQSFGRLKDVKPFAKCEELARKLVEGRL